MKCKFNNVKVSGISAVVPDNMIDVNDEIKFYNNENKLLERNKKILGLGTRYVVKEKTSNSDLCEAAANNLLEKLNIDRKSIDALIVTSTSHDYIYPASSCILQSRLNLSEFCACFDLSGLACSAYVYALWNAHNLIASGTIKRCLLLAGDTVSLHSDPRNRNSNMLFGDAATATLLEYSDEKVESYFYLGTKGEEWNKIIAPAGGSKLPIRKDIVDIEVKDMRGNVWHLWDEIMKGMDVFKFVMDIGPKGIKEILELSHNAINDIDFFAFHQANKQIVDSVAKISSVPLDKYSTRTFSKYANCASASIAVNICDLLFDKVYSKVLLSSFGVGLSYGFALINYSFCKNLGVSFYTEPKDAKNRLELITEWINFFQN